MIPLLRVPPCLNCISHCKALKGKYNMCLSSKTTPWVFQLRITLDLKLLKNVCKISLIHVCSRTGAQLFSNDDTFESFDIRQFYSWFYSGVVRWLDIAAYKALQRIERAVELDNFAPVDSTVQYSSSAIDTMAIFHQVDILRLVALPIICHIICLN